MNLKDHTHCEIARKVLNVDQEKKKSQQLTAPEIGNRTIIK